tara:strand:+ start:14311 stop:14703 length:393 start_codon:yes stop_codon:yes gene_type:complete
MNEYLILTFNGIVNVSLSVGDKVYFTGDVSESGGFDTSDDNAGNSNLIYLGKVYSITQNDFTFIIYVEDDEGSLSQVSSLTQNSFIFFAKNNKVELSSLVGYYSKVRLSNNSKVKAEIFATSMDVSQSSK